MSIMSMTQPYLFARSIGGILISIGHVALVINFAWMLFGKKDASSSAPTLFRNPPEMKVNRA
jgi:cytochrome c oxidase cbb3-type subunit 1